MDLTEYLRARLVAPMPARFQPLAVYNSEVARGCAHTPEWGERMAALQADFDEYIKASSGPRGPTA